jgi:tRNA threonylcarbamoyl adenosine modification protein YeaZ
MRTLLIDTTGRTLFAGLVDEGRLVSRRELPSGRATADIHPLIREALAAEAWALTDLEQVAVIRGPGNWTGVNVGVVASKLIALPLGLPMTVLSRAGALALNAPDDWTRGIVVIPAGRQAYFVSRFDGVESSRAAELGSERVDSRRLAEDLDASPPHGVVSPAEDDVDVSHGFGGATRHARVDRDTLIETYVRQIHTGTGVIAVGDGVHLVLPDYAGADGTIQTGPGALR